MQANNNYFCDKKVINITKTDSFVIGYFLKYISTYVLVFKNNFFWGQCCSSDEKILQIQEERQLLSSALLSLTTHFAQVQFRLKQILQAPHQDKERLLILLEEFACKGVQKVIQLIN